MGGEAVPFLPQKPPTAGMGSHGEEALSPSAASWRSNRDFAHLRHLLTTSFFFFFFFSGTKTSLYWPRLLEGDESGGVGGTDPGPAVLHGFVGDGELAQVVADHLWFDLHLVEGLAVVHAHHATHHLRQDDHVPQVRLHHLRLLHGWCLLFGLSQALEQ